MREFGIKMTWEIPLFKIYWDDDDVEAVTAPIRAGMNWAIGQNIEKFEEMIAEYVGTEYAMVFNSGTSALHTALLAHGLKKGDEVIVPSFTFIATANAPLHWSKTGLCGYRRYNLWFGSGRCEGENNPENEGNYSNTLWGVSLSDKRVERNCRRS